MPRNSFGLSVARRILQLKLGSVKVIEKEQVLGVHSSGRNSGVLHTGIYYPPGSLKAKLCVSGAAQLREYLREHGLPFQACGKLIVPQEEKLESQIEILRERAIQNGVRAQVVTPDEIAEIEPMAIRNTRALYSPDTWIFDPKEVLKSLAKEINSANGVLSLDEAYRSFDPDTQSLQTSSAKYFCGTLVNAGGLWADKIAHKLGAGLNYQILPFRGRYKQLLSPKAEKIRGLIYPVPDMELPFLGLHITKGIHGTVTVGPTATPALGRENYQFYRGIKFNDSLRLANLISSYAFKNTQNMRRHMFEEIHLQLPAYFAKMAQRLLPSLEQQDLTRSGKLGTRAQVIRKSDLSLCMDFIVENEKNSVHIINAVSPAFSSCLAFADWIVQEKLISK